MTRIIKGLQFVQTHDECPEEHIIMDSKKYPLGAVRLRWGELMCSCPDLDGEVVYNVSFGESLKGRFLYEDERTYYLGQIADVVLKKLQKEGRLRN